MDKITAARFTALGADGATVEFTTASPVLDGVRVSVYADKYGARPIQTAVAVKLTDNVGTVTFDALGEDAFDFSADYRMRTESSPRVTIDRAALVDSAKFISVYETAEVQNLEYGATVCGRTTVFRLWAPFATGVVLNLYAAGDRASDRPLGSHPMRKRITGGGFGGVWELVLAGDLSGRYYTYSVTNFGQTAETIDPYARACGVNGDRGMIVDLRATDPDGWAHDTRLAASRDAVAAGNADVPIVWELHVGDFSASPDSGMVNKGKYLAFTESGTTVPGMPRLKTGVDYLKELGVTYVHLNPVYDFATVDEGALGLIEDPDFNWGYDPENYNIPEGSYSTDPARGEVRIREFKQMVMALHAAGIGVVMDVVYNHTYQTGGQAFHDAAPFYYHRTSRGRLSNASGCGNETATERAMMRKYLIESVLYWANEYHIDGFRFDLMGIHDLVTIKTLRAALDRLDGGRGKKILMYGEPWAADNTGESFYARTAATERGEFGRYGGNANNCLIKDMFMYNGLSALPERVAVFNGSGRDAVRGGNDGPGRGWANGEAARCMSGVMKMLEGGCGSTGCGMSLASGSQNVAYACAHDNYTLWDQVVGWEAGKKSPMYYENAISENVKKCKLAAAACLASSGICFMLAGEEMGRTKHGNHNSYNSPSKLNRIEWSRQNEFAELTEFYKKLIALRKNNADAFGYASTVTVEGCTGNFTGSDDCTGKIVYTVRRGKKEIVFTLDPQSLSGSIAVDGIVEIEI